MFQIKICGITSAEDAVAVAECGADAVGLNFYSSSARCVTRPVASAISSAIRGKAASVGLFVNHPVEGVIAISDSLQLDYIQLHGDETVDWLDRLAPRRVIFVIRLRDGLDQVERFLESVARTDQHPAALLIDSYKEGEFGGTGYLANWQEVANLQKLEIPYPVILAGGLTAANVGQAIVQTGCRAVDVASGVESAPGQKDLAEVRRFVAEAKTAFSTRGSGPSCSA